MGRDERERERSALAAIVVVALALRAVVLVLSGPSTLRFGDSVSYLETAAALCRDGSYPWSSNLPFFRAPGLPVFIAAVTGCHPEGITWVKATLAMLDAGTIVIAFLLAKALELDGRTALLAAALAAIHPMFLQASSDVTTEPLTTFLVAAWLAAIAWGWRTPRARGFSPWLLAGVLAGLAALTRPAALLCVPLGVASVAVPRRRSIPEMALHAALLLGGAMAVIAPWSLVASRAAGGLVIVNDAGGYNFWRGTHPDLARASASGDAATFRRESLRFERETSPRVAAEVARASSTPAARDRAWLRLALDNLADDPRAAAAFTVTKARGYWRPWPDRSAAPTWLVVCSAAILVPILCGGAIGLVRLWRMRPRQALFFVVFLLTPWLAQLPHQIVSRFRLPFSEVLLCVLAAWVASDLWPFHPPHRLSPSPVRVISSPRDCARSR